MYKSWMWKQRSFREQFQGDEAGSTTGGAGDVQEPDGQAGAGGEQSEASAPGEGQEASGTDPEVTTNDDEVVITLGDEAPAAENDEQFHAAPAWVKELRKSDREKARRIRELEQKLATGQQAQQPQQIDVGPKPNLEDDDIAFDAEKYAEKLLAWTDRKRKADEQAAKAKQDQEAVQAAWQKKQDSYKAAGAALKVPDFDDAEAVVQTTLSEIQQAILVSGADNPAALVYALGKNPAEAKKLAAIKDPVQYAFAAAKLETTLKVQPRKAPPPAERQVRGNAGASTAIDPTLARLEAEADRTGDRTKVVAYKREQRSKAA